MQNNKILYLAILALGFNFLLLAGVSKSRNSQLKYLQAQNDSLQVSLLEVKNKFDTAVLLSSKYFTDISSPLTAIDWVYYSHYFYDSKNSYNLNFEISGCVRKVQINNLQVWFVSENKTLKDYAIVTGNCTYNYDCNNLQNSGTYDFHSYTTMNKVFTGYSVNNDSTQLLLQASAIQLNGKDRVCKVSFTEYYSNKEIGSIEFH